MNIMMRKMMINEIIIITRWVELWTTCFTFPKLIAIKEVI